MPNSYQDFPTKVFVDSNIILECLPLPDLPWRDLNRSGPILVLLLPQVTREVDSKKHDGRLAQRARAFNRFCIPAIETDTPVEIVSGAVNVSFTIADCDRIPWEKYGDLDPDDPDALIVAQALHAKGIGSGDVVFVSQDTGALVRARRGGLTCFHAPEAWLRSAEKSPEARKVVTLQQDINILRKSLPELSIGVDIEPEPYELYQVASLSDAERASYIESVLRSSPREVQERKLGLVLYDFDYDNKYDRFRDDAVPEFARKLQSKIELQFNQIPLSITVRNNGEVMAADVEIAWRMTGGWLNHKPIFVPLRPTLPRVSHVAPLPLHLHDPQLFQKGGLVERESNSSMEIGPLRHEHEWTWSGVVWLDVYAGRDAHLELRVTASNLNGSVISSRPLPIRLKVVSAGSMVDLSDVKLTQDSRLTPLFDAVRKTKKLDDIEIDRDPSESD